MNQHRQRGGDPKRVAETLHQFEDQLGDGEDAVYIPADAGEEVAEELAALTRANAVLTVEVQRLSKIAASVTVAVHRLELLLAEVPLVQEDRAPRETDEPTAPGDGHRVLWWRRRGHRR